MEISPGELREKLSSDQILLLDVRTPAEYGSCHVRGALNIPLDNLTKERVAGLAAGKEQVITICQSGKRGGLACDRIVQWGFENAGNVRGGTLQCKSDGLPLVEGQQKVISLERQVRIAAGALVLSGVVLSQLHAESWIYLSAFVGAGLIFAGITDTCGMGMLISKMPWNRQYKDKASCRI